VPGTKDVIYPDNCNVILTCNGLALKNKLGYGRTAKIVRSQFFKTPLEIPLNRELKLHIETVKDAIIKQIPSLKIG
jgi:hypothetical protein